VCEHKRCHTFPNTTAEKLVLGAATAPEVSNPDGLPPPSPATPPTSTNECGFISSVIKNKKSNNLKFICFIEVNKNKIYNSNPCKR
jgi:hypothetical protein